jgi:hypothetical protein
MTVAIPTANHSNAIALPSKNESAAMQLVEWAQAAQAAFQLADALCATQFAPAAYRGKAQEAAAAMLAGAEVGLSPMASLRAFDNIQGTPAPKAATLRAIAQAHGHEVRIVESTPDRAVVTGRRKGETEWQTSTWDLARAEQMSLTGKSQWKQQPGAMLIARATSEACRWIAMDAIMGMPYSAEEIRDHESPAFEGRTPARRVTAAEILGATGDQPAHEVTLASPEQVERVLGLWDDLGFVGEENEQNRLTITAKIVGVEVLASLADLTAEQADVAAEALEVRKAQQGGKQS